MSQRLLIDNIKKNHRRFHLFFVLIIATAVTFGFYQLTLIGSQITDAQTSLPVVPGAYGFGMNTRAAYACGVDPVILKVTSLADSGAGTLRAALNDTRPRIIVFEISGTIALNSYIDFTSPCVTIAGQTAPSPGILIKNYSLKINARDVLVQHLRFRPGWDAQAMNCNKGLIVAEDTVDVYNVVMDHISGSWAAGKVYTIGDYRTTRDITFWRSISAEGLYQPYDQLDNYGQYTQCGSSAPDPAYGMLIVPVTNMSVLQSIFKDHLERNPVTGGDASLYVANNVIHGFGQGTAWGVDPYYYPRWPGKMTVIGNVYRYSSKINQYGTDAAIQAYLKASWNCEPGFRCIDGSNPNDNLQLYYSDNKKDIKYPGLSIYDARAFEWDPAACQGYCDYNLPSMSTKPIDLPGYPVLPSSQVFDLVLNNAGARPADRAIEKVDEGIINDIRTFADFRFVNAEDPVRGIPESYPYGGMPNLAVNTRSLTPPTNTHGDDDGDGYRNMEEWLHCYADQVEGRTCGSASPPPPAPLPPPPTSANTFYVATNGDDTRSCTTANNISTPKKTLNNAVQCLGPGKTLFVRAGTYAEALLFNTPAGTSWTSLARIAAYQGEAVWMKPSAGQNANRVLEFGSGQQYIEFDGINLDGTDALWDTVKVNAVDVGNQAHHIRIKNATVKAPKTNANWVFGVLSTQVDPGLIGFNEYINLTVIGQLGGLHDGFSHGFYIQSSNNLIEGNNISNFEGNGVQIYNGNDNYALLQEPDNNTVRYNTIHDLLNLPGGQARRGVVIGGGSGNKIYGNLIYNVSGSANWTAGIHMYDGSNTEIYNNTTHNINWTGIYVDGGTNATIRNNIAWNNGVANFAQVGGTIAAISNNLGDSDTGWTNQDPQFVDAVNKNFRLKSTSPAINTGSNASPIPTLVTKDLDNVTRPQGSAYDIGAYEFASGGTPPPPPSSTTCPSPASNAFTGCYYTGTNFNTLALTRTDNAITFNWGTTSPSPSMSSDNFSVRWIGNFTFATNNYTFTVTTDDGMRLYIDNTLVIDKWLDQGATTYSVTRAMTQGSHQIKVEYYESAGDATAIVYWNQVSTAPPPPPTSANTFYVATNGDDSRSCDTAKNINTPKRTINGARNCPVPGETVYIRGGTYAEELSWRGGPRGTSWSSPVTFKAYPGETVIVRPNVGAEFAVDLRNTATGVDNAPKYLIFDGMTFDGRNVNYDVVKITEYDGLLETDGGYPASYIRFINFRVTSNNNPAHTQQGFLIGGHHIELINGEIDHIGSLNAYPNSQGTYGAGNDLLIDGVHFHDIEGYCASNINSKPGYDVNNHIIRNNVMHDCVFGGINEGEGTGHEIYNNIVYNTGGNGIYINDFGAAIFTANGIKVYNNTSFSNANYGIGVNGNIDNTIVRNNISYSNGTDYHNGRSTTIASDNSWQDFPGQDPMFVNATGADFRLQSSSPAIDRGTPISLFSTDFEGTTRPQGSAWDIGADEFGAGSTVPPPGPVPPPTYSQGAYTQPPPPPSSTVCSITNVTWSATSYTVGTTATANITVNDSTACQNKTLTIYIYEEDPFSFDDILVGPATLTFNSSTNTTTYTHLFTTQDYTNGGNESGNESIYFTVQLQGQTTYSRSNQINFYSTSTQPPPAPLPPPTYNQATYQGSYTQPPPPPPTYNQATYQGSYSPPPPAPGPQQSSDVFENFTLWKIPAILSGLSCYFIQFAIILFSIWVIYTGIRFLMSRGNSTEYGGAKKTLVYALLGGLIIYGVYTIIATIITLFGYSSLPWLPLSC